MVHKYCPCLKSEFKKFCYATLSKALFQTSAYDLLDESNQKTVQNHLTEIAGTFLGLYYPTHDEYGNTYINESESCKYLVENNDFPTFFKNLCLNFQFPNGAKWIQTVQDEIKNKVHIKPFCYTLSLLYYAQKQKIILTKQEVGYYVLNNLDVLQGNIAPEVVYNRIIQDRKNKVKREKLSGSREWQHINEQFNLLELSNLVESDATYIWLNKAEQNCIEIFINHINDFAFDAYKYDLSVASHRNQYVEDWKYVFGKFNEELLSITTQFSVEIADKDELIKESGATKSAVDLGDDGEALVFRIEQERVRKYKERLVNKVLLLGKTKGLGYDISSIEADENPQKPEFARYIEVKSTKRVTEPTFDNSWSITTSATTPLPTRKFMSSRAKTISTKRWRDFASR